MNKTTTAREFIRRQTLGTFSINEGLAREQGYELSSRYGGTGHNFEEGGGLEIRPTFCFFSFLLRKFSISLFLPLRGGTKPARQEADFALGWHGCSACSPFFRFPFSFLLSWIPTALMLFAFSSLVYGWEGSLWLCLRGMAFYCFFGVAVVPWIRCRAIWNYANVLIF